MKWSLLFLLIFGMVLLGCTTVIVEDVVFESVVETQSLNSAPISFGVPMVKTVRGDFNLLNVSKTSKGFNVTYGDKGIFWSVLIGNGTKNVTPVKFKQKYPSSTFGIDIIRYEDKIKVLPHMTVPASVASQGFDVYFIPTEAYNIDVRKLKHKGTRVIMTDFMGIDFQDIKENFNATKAGRGYVMKDLHCENCSFDPDIFILNVTRTLGVFNQTFFNASFGADGAIELLINESFTGGTHISIVQNATTDGNTVSPDINSVNISYKATICVGCNLSSEIRVSNNSYIMDFDWGINKTLDIGQIFIGNWNLTDDVMLGRPEGSIQQINQSGTLFINGSVGTIPMLFGFDINQNGKPYNFDGLNFTHFMIMGKVKQTSTDSFSSSENNRVGITSHIREDGGSNNQRSWAFIWAGGARGLALLEEGVAWRATSSANVLPRNEWWWMKLVVNGTTLTGKSWRDGDPEPLSFNVTSSSFGTIAADFKGAGFYCGTVDCVFDELRICPFNSTNCDGFEEWTERNFSNPGSHPAANFSQLQVKTIIEVPDATATVSIEEINFTLWTFIEGVAPPVGVDACQCPTSGNLFLTADCDFVNATCNMAFGDIWIKSHFMNILHTSNITARCLQMDDDLTDHMYLDLTDEPESQLVLNRTSCG